MTKSLPLASLALAALALAALALGCDGGPHAAPAAPDARGSRGAPDAASVPPEAIDPSDPVGSPTEDGWIYLRLEDPARTEVFDARGDWLATFTDGARTATIAGDERVFVDASARPVTHSVWVRLLDEPYDPERGVAPEWLRDRLRDRTADVLAVASEYLADAPTLWRNGLRVAGDADYGPLIDGSRQEGSDFNDYLGVAWRYADGLVDENEPHQYGSLDCSGYVRMVFGYRGVVPFVGTSDGGGVALPRRAVQMAASAPGVLTIPDAGVAPPPSAPLAPGDLVFFDASTDDGTAIDHVGIYLGVDDIGGRRFLSSRKGANGPTFGDVMGPSLLDGIALYARSFRAARRL